MTFRRAAFKHYYLVQQRGSPNSFNAYSSALGRIDELIEGLDEKIEEIGLRAVRSWGKEESRGPFALYASNTRSALNAYLGFASSSSLDGGDEQPPAEQSAQIGEPNLTFDYERDLQRAVRRHLDRLEPNLVEEDGGYEASTRTGRVDILSRDPGGKLVVVELKAGACPPGALEQLLGYMQSISEERGADVRGFLVAGSFSERIRAAAARIPDVELRSYELSVTFNSV